MKDSESISSSEAINNTVLEAESAIKDIKEKINSLNLKQKKLISELDLILIREKEIAKELNEIELNAETAPKYNLLLDEKRSIKERKKSLEISIENNDNKRSCLIKEQENVLFELKTKGEKRKSNRSDLSWTAKKAVSAPIEIATNTVKNGLSTINPLDRSINKNEVSDSGAESIRLAYTSAKKGRKTVKTTARTIKTTNKAIKTASNVIKTSGNVIYKGTASTVKAAVSTTKITIAAVTHIVAFLINPIVIILFGFLIICMTVIGGMLTIIAGDSTDKEAKASAAGLVEVDKQYNNGVDYFNTSLNNAKSSFYNMIDSLYFSDSDLTNSDLVYMEQRKSDVLQYSYGKGFASNTYKDRLKSAWNLTLNSSEVLAITYVYLEKEQNNLNGTSLEIYEVTYTQEVLDKIISEYVSFTDTVYGGQKCPSGSCTEHINPEYQAALENVSRSANAYNDWFDMIQYFERFNTINDGTAQAQYWEQNVQWRIDNWLLVYSTYYNTPYYTNNGNDFLNYLGRVYEAYVEVERNTPKTLDECEYKHHLHSIDLRFYTNEDVMNSLGFTDSEKEWVKLTEQGFASNPNI